MNPSFQKFGFKIFHFSLIIRLKICSFRIRLVLLVIASRCGRGRPWEHVPPKGRENLGIIRFFWRLLCFLGKRKIYYAYFLAYLFSPIKVKFLKTKICYEDFFFFLVFKILSSIYALLFGSKHYQNFSLPSN